MNNASMFGISAAALAGDVTENASSYIAAASRWVDSYTFKSYSPDDIVESHNWDPMSRRIYVYNPPVLSVSDYRVIVGGPSAGFVQFNVANLVINNSLNYVELPELAAVTAGALAAPFIPVGLFQPYVQITYKSTANISPSIKLATGLIASAMISQAILAKTLPVGLQSIQVGQVRAARSPKGGSFEVPQIVIQILDSEKVIGIA